MKKLIFPQLRPRERLLALGSAVFLFIVLLDRLALSPWLEHARKVRQETRRMELAIEQHGRILARRDAVEKQLAKYQRYLRPALADELQMAELLKEVESIAQRSRVTVSEIKPLDVTTDRFLTRYALDVRFECTLEEWVEFIVGIESSSSIFQVTRAGLSVQDDIPDRLEAFLRVVSTAAGGLGMGSNQ